MNEIRSLPKKLSFPMLKIMNVNRNADLKELSLKYIPLLENLSASYCSLEKINCLLGCYNLNSVDISFNKLPALESFISAFWPCKNLVSLIFNDNQFNYNIQEDIQSDLD